VYGFPGEMFHITDATDVYLRNETCKVNAGYCRVWWRTYDERWALIPKLLHCDLSSIVDINSDITNYFSSYSQEINNYLQTELYGKNNRNSFYNFIKDRFFSYDNLIFCMWDDYYDKQIYTIGNNCIYNNNYNIPLRIIVNYKSLNNNGLIKGTSNIYGNLQFKTIDSDYQIVPLEKSLTLSSSENL